MLGIGLPWWHNGKESSCQCRRHKRPSFDLSVGKIPWRRKQQPSTLAWEISWTQDLVGYRPWGRKELDTMEQLTLSRGQQKPHSIHRDHHTGSWPTSTTYYLPRSLTSSLADKAGGLALLHSLLKHLSQQCTHPLPSGQENHHFPPGIHTDPAIR